MWRRIRSLIVKEFLALLKDKRGRMVLIVPPLLQMFVFSYAATFEVRNVALAVLNEDAGPAGRELIARFSASPYFVETVRLTHEREIPALIADKDALMVVHLAGTFSADLLGRQSAPVQIIVDGRRSNTALIALGYAQNIVTGFGREWAAAHGLPGPAANLVVRAWFNPNLLSSWYIISGMVALITVVVTLMVTALSVARERELGTFEQLLVTPLRPVEVLIGKVVPAIVIGFVEGMAILAFARFWFHLPFAGSVSSMLASIAVFLLALTGVGLMISSICKTQQQATLGVFLFLMPAVILSGFGTPIANMTPWVQYLTYLNPMRYMLIILRGIFLQDMPAAVVLGNLWPMALIALATLTVAAWFFRRRLY